MRQILRFIRPIQLLLALLSYGLGLGLARYLGATLLLETQFLGGVVVVFLLAASGLLVAYFRPYNEPLVQCETRKEREEMRSIFLMVALILLGLVGILVFMLQRAGFLSAQPTIILIIFVFLALADAVPPFRLSNRGLGELSAAVQTASLTPTLAFLLQYGGLHRLLTIFTFPLVLLSLAYFLAINFPAYAEDLKYERRSLLTSISWERAIPLHNALLFGAYFFLAAAPFFGISPALIWPALLTLPLAAYQVFSLRTLADGAKPVWSVFLLTATALPALTIYLITLTFWLR